MDQLNYETIKNYQSFTTVEEMDQAVRGFLYTFKASLSEGALKVLHFLWRYSVKVVGVSFAKYDTMAGELGLSRRTVIRAVKVLEELAFIKKVPTARMNGKQGVNLYVIQHFSSIDSLLQPVSPQPVTASVTPNKTEYKQRSLCENNKLNRYIVKKANLPHSSVESFGEETTDVTSQEIYTEENRLLKEEGVEEIRIQAGALDPSFLPDYVHQDFIRAARPFFGAEDIYKLWTKIYLAYQKIGLTAALDEVIDDIITDFKQTIFTYKLGKIHTTFEGYFYRVVYGRLWDLKKQEYKHQWYENVVGSSDCHPSFVE